MSSARSTARLDQVLHWRDRQAKVRYAYAVLGFAYLLTCTPIFLAIVWLAVSAAFQLLERIVSDHLNSAGLEARHRARVFGLAMISINSAAYGSISWIALVHGDSTILAGATLSLAACLLFSVMSTRGSLQAFAAVFAPYVVLVIGFLIIATRLDLPFMGVVNLTMACALILSIASMIWRLSSEMLGAEEVALAEACAHRAEADAANAAKSAFVSMVSHELRTPMSAILAGASALVENADGSARAHGSLIADAGSMMRVLLDDLLDLAKIEAGKMDIEDEPFEARALVLRTLAFWRVPAAAKGIRLRLEGSHHLDPWMRGDPTRLRQILNNLISNALKFTDRGAVTLRVSHGAAGLCFEVEDTGAGMTEPQLQALFKPFEQGLASRARTHGGTGLGLSISRNLARLMGGDLQASSRPGCGSSFTLSTTLSECAEPERDCGAVADAVLNDELGVLVVDDHEINQRALKVMLDALGARIEIVASGQDALAILATNTFDVVLMDVNMEGLSGIETTRRLRAEEGPNRDVPIIAVTGSVEVADIEVCLSAGMTSVVAKPIVPAILFAAISRALDTEESVDTRSAVELVRLPEAPDNAAA